MFNVTVLKLKDIKKYFIGLLLTTIVVVLASKYFPKMSEGKKLAINIEFQNSMLGCLKQAVPVMSSINEEYKKMDNENEEVKEENLLQGILKTQISSIKGMEEIEEKAKQSIKEEAQQENQIENTETEQEQNIEITEIVETAQTGLSTQIITNNPIKESYNLEYGKVKIKNETDYELTRRYFKSRH